MGELIGMPIQKLTDEARPPCSTAEHRGTTPPPADYKLTRPPDDEYPNGDTAYVCTPCLALFLYRVAPRIEP